MSEYMKAGQFKAECLKVMETVKRTKRRVVITKRNVPIAQLVPIDKEDSGPIFGCMADSMSIKGDIVKPTGEKWNVLD